MKILIYVILILFLFFRGYFPNDAVYWGSYGLAFFLLVALWFNMFWVGRKKAIKISGFEPDFDIFCARVPLDVSADLIRGRLCIGDGKLVLVKKTKGKYSIEWQTSIENIKSIGFGTVAGVRKGFTVHENDKDTDFTCARIKKHSAELFKALGWELEAENV